MCDEIGPVVSQGKSEDPDHFPVGWHPHFGMDILSYQKQGTGRHADSLGNRGEFRSPGFQWMSVGSGIEHAEGGGTAAGEMKHGFQIWINVPREHKQDDPRYGTEQPENMVDIAFPGGSARLLAGEMEGRSGPFKTVQPVQMVDVELESGADYAHFVPVELDNCLVYVYRGEAVISDESVSAQHVARFDATDPDARNLAFKAGPDGMGAMIFAGKRINEQIAWHGPMVASSRAELSKVFKDVQSGQFPPKRVPWNYRRASARPRDV
jgi:redox-sensitive bicupin YhaK (pirin superfamily)